MNSLSQTAPDDLIQPFRIDPFALRGRLVRLGPAIDRILSQHDYPEPVAAMLGEAITLAVVLAGALKYDGIFTLQTKGDGPIRMMVADVSTEGALRGYAQYDEAKLEAALARARASSPSVPLLVGSGYIAFTVDQGEDTDRYQGIVELAGSTLTECAHHYFRQSEQVQAGIKLSVGRSGPGGTWRAGGLMLQRVPPEGGYAVIADDVEDGWRRAMVLMSSATPEELVDPDLPPHGLLYRLFHEEGVRVYDTHSLEARCRCSRERIEGILRAFPPDELDDMRKEGRHHRDLRVLQHALRVRQSRSRPAHAGLIELELESPTAGPGRLDRVAPQKFAEDRTAIAVALTPGAGLRKIRAPLGRGTSNIRCAEKYRCSKTVPLFGSPAAKASHGCVRPSSSGWCYVAADARRASRCGRHR